MYIHTPRDICMYVHDRDSRVHLYIPTYPKIQICLYMTETLNCIPTYPKIQICTYMCTQGFKRSLALAIYVLVWAYVSDGGNSKSLFFRDLL
jgi:hypothetical protein